MEQFSEDSHPGWSMGFISQGLFLSPQLCGFLTFLHSSKRTGDVLVKMVTAKRLLSKAACFLKLTSSSFFLKSRFLFWLIWFFKKNSFFPYKKENKFFPERKWLVIFMCIRPWFFSQDIREKRTRNNHSTVQWTFYGCGFDSCELQVKTHLETRKSPDPLRLQLAGEGGVSMFQLSDPRKTKRELQTFEVTVPFAAAPLWRGGF